MRDQLKLSDELEQEGAAFDVRLRERLAHGHIPDLRQVVPVDWFQNNVWRRPLFVNMLNQPVIDFCRANLVPGSRVLEVGCGPGHMSLELARNGFRVTGLDVARETLDVARKLAEENPFRENWGHLDYVRADFLDWEPDSKETFDAICFFGALHHFPDAGTVLDRSLELLGPRGRIVAYEPARDWWLDKDAALLVLIRLVLDAAHAWYREMPQPRNREDLDALIAATLAEIREAHPAGEPAQSPRDNSAYGTEMLAALRSRLDELAFAPATILFDRTVAGIRLDDEERTASLAVALMTFELYALETGLMRPAGFMFAGQRKGR